MKRSTIDPARPAQRHFHILSGSASLLTAAACALLLAAPLAFFAADASAQARIGVGGDGGGSGGARGPGGGGRGPGTGPGMRPGGPGGPGMGPGAGGGPRGGAGFGRGGDSGRPSGPAFRQTPPRGDFNAGYRGDNRGRDIRRPDSARWDGPRSAPPYRYAPPPRYAPSYRYGPPRYAAPWPAWRPGWRWDGYYGHNHYYPPYGYSVSFLSPGYLSFAYGSGRFFFSSGIWYRPSGSSYVVIAPPIGIGIPVLPPYATPVVIDGTSYYYANGAYYAPAAGTSGYVVVNPPASRSNVEVTPEPARPPASEVFAYPREQQGHEQIERDRSECEDWAADEVNKMNGHTVDGDYQRALSACLEGRGYTVR